MDTYADLLSTLLGSYRIIRFHNITLTELCMEPFIANRRFSFENCSGFDIMFAICSKINRRRRGAK